MAEVPELMQNVCGTLVGNFMITEMVDDPVKRDYAVYNAYDHTKPETATQVYIASIEAPRWRWEVSMSVTERVLKTVQNRSAHFPSLVSASRVKRLIFGADGVQDVENDPEFLRTVLVLQTAMSHSLLSTILAYSPTGLIPVELALRLGIGMVRALAALNKAGFNHRLVSPHSFSYFTPPNVESLINRLIITDLSLCIAWPRKPRNYVPFVGTQRYSALSVHLGREQGPNTDIISVIYVIAEMINGRLPWRSLTNMNEIKQAKLEFPKQTEFHRLPREIRGLYRDMMVTFPQAKIDYEAIQQKFKDALSRKEKDNDTQFDLPSWLTLPCDD